MKLALLPTGVFFLGLKVFALLWLKVRANISLQMVHATTLLVAPRKIPCRVPQETPWHVPARQAEHLEGL
jgi:hypothetical protein